MSTPENPPLLNVDGLRVRFDTRRGPVLAVNGVSLEIGADEVLAVVGESGSGKTLTGLSVLGLEPPGAAVTGHAWFRGEDLRALPAGRLRSIRGGQISMVFQDPMTSLNPSLTVGRQVGEVVRLAERLSREAVRDRVTDLFGQVRMPSPERFLGAYPHQLSGGMRQRVMIAMAIARRPALLIADEPTTALDPTIAAQILDLLASLRASMRMSVLLITHNLALVRGMADRVIVMYAGHVLEEAPTARLFEAPAHPYTEGLLASVPRAGASRLTSRLTPIPGQVPLLREAPDSCVFGPRCPHVRDECRVAQPPLEGGAHSAACVLRRLPEARKAGGQA